MEIRNLSVKEFKVMLINMLTKVRRRMDEHSKNFNQETQNTRKYQIEVTELKNTITEMKNIPERFNITLDEAEERISELKDRVVELTESEQQKEKKIF